MIMGWEGPLGMNLGAIWKNSGLILQRYTLVWILKITTSLELFKMSVCKLSLKITV